MKIKPLAIVAALFLLTACYRAVGVEVSELSGNRLSIAATETGLADRPCVEGVLIYRLAAQQRTQVWSVALDDQTQCIGEFTYPETPSGYRTVVAPADLNPGDELEVEIMGAGFDAATRLVKS